jgi:hypothetical protein
MSGMVNRARGLTNIEAQPEGAERAAPILLFNQANNHH